MVRLRLVGFLAILFGACGESAPVGPAPPDTVGVAVNPEWAAWIAEHSIPIASLSSNDFADLQFLKPLLADRRLVQLGENGHGVGEFDSVKVRLVKFLHEEMGFDVIAFESSIYTCFAAYQDETLSPFDMMKYSIFAVWHTEEVLALFQYMQEDRQTARPLVLAGFDIQRTSWFGNLSRPSFLFEVVAQIDMVYAAEVRSFDESFIGSRNVDSLLVQNGDALANQYQALIEFLDEHEDSLAALYSDNPAIPLIARQTAWSLTQQIMLLRAPTLEIEYQVRDRAMADNVQFLLETLYPDKRVIVWAHNWHVRHRQMEVQGGQRPGLPSMGTYVSQRHRHELYTVGLYMHSGTVTSAYDLHVFSVARPPRNGIERILHEAGLPYLFVDMLNQESSPGNSWMFEQVGALDQGITEEYMVPRDQYDAILFVDVVHPPRHIVWWD